MPKTSQNGLKFLAFTGGLALLILSARVTVPMYPEPTTLLSFTAVLLGVLAGVQMGSVTGCLYAVSLCVGLTSFLDDHGFAWDNPLGIRNFGFTLGLPLAAALAGRIAPGGQGSAGKIFGATAAGHAVYIAAGTLWLLRFGSWHHALDEGFVAHVLPCLAKSVAAFATVMVLRKVV